MKNFIVTSSFTIFILLGAGYLFFSSVVENFKIKELNINESSPNVYMKNLQRGLNYNESSISLSKSRRTNPKIDYVFTWDEMFFYRISNDSLIIYCSSKALEPQNFNPRIKVIQIVYSNPEFFELSENYKRMGLEKFPD